MPAREARTGDLMASRTSISRDNLQSVLRIPPGHGDGAPSPLFLVESVHQRACRKGSGHDNQANSDPSVRKHGGLQTQPRPAKSIFPQKRARRTNTQSQAEPTSPSRQVVDPQAG